MCAYKRRAPIPTSEGGTGAASFTPYAIVCGGSNSVNPMQCISSVGTSGQVLTSNGSSAWPTFQTISSPSSITSVTGTNGGAQSGPGVTLSGGSTGLSLTGSANTFTMAFTGITANGGTVALATDSATSSVNIGTGAGVKTVTIGSTNTTSTLALKYGTSGFSLASNTGNTIAGTSAGQITMPLQPAFLAYVNTTLTNKTGDGTAYTVVFDTEIYDQNSNFSSNTFTAPVTGRYHFSFSLYIRNLGLLFTNGFLTLVTSNRTYLVCQGNYGALQSGTRVAVGSSVYCDMDANDTASLVVQIFGSTKTTDVLGVDVSGTTASFFSGVLVV